jgi:hypothetical protein
LVHVLQELDFVNEAKNCEQCAHNFATMSPELASKIAFPKIYWQWSTSKLLTMEFMEGVGITDVQAIRGLGFRPADVASLEFIIRNRYILCINRGRRSLATQPNHGLYQLQFYCTPNKGRNGSVHKV